MCIMSSLDHRVWGSVPVISKCVLVGVDLLPQGMDRPPRDGWMEVNRDMGFSLLDRRISAAGTKEAVLGRVGGSLPLTTFQCRPYHQLMEEEGLSSTGPEVLLCFGLKTEALT